MTFSFLLLAYIGVYLHRCLPVLGYCRAPVLAQFSVDTFLEMLKLKLTYCLLHRLRFTLVSEPAAEEDDEDCIEIGYAYISLSEILRTGRDFIGAEIPSQQLII